MRNVVVTGGTRGLGLAIAGRLATGGYRVIAVARAESAAFAELRRSNSATPDSLQFRPFDLSDLAGIPRFVRGLSEEFGGWHGLVNNAGIGTSGILATLQDHHVEQILRMNVTSPITLTKYAVRAMMVARGGRIVNVSSIVAAQGYSGLSVYSASKAALGGFTRSLARELGPIGITVNCVAPGFIATDMTAHAAGDDLAKVKRRSALRRLAEPEDVAGAVAYLMSDEARNITGVTLTVDAGSTA